MSNWLLVIARALRPTRPLTERLSDISAMESVYAEYAREMIGALRA